MWDPIIDKATLEFEVRIEGTKWELDQIEKYKDEIEAKIDEDERNPVTKNKLARATGKLAKVKQKNPTFNEKNKFGVD